jgi:molybdenum cofactor guanylyltransferase
MFDVEGFILVGGASSRMGSDKSQMIFAGQKGVERIAAALESVAARIRLVGPAVDSAYSSFEHVSDLHEHWGALGGIHAALTACQSDWAVIVACDLPLVSSELFLRLWGLAKDRIEAVVPIQIDKRIQPLCAFYRRQPCLTWSEQVIAAGEHTPRALLSKVNTRRVEFAELSDLPGARNFFLNVNTPADYELAERIIAEQAAPQ